MKYMLFLLISCVSSLIFPESRFYEKYCLKYCEYIEIVRNYLARFIDVPMNH